MTTQTLPQPSTVTRKRTSWRLALRIARRDAWRHRGRSAVVFLMIMLPVLLVVAGATLVRTATLTPVEQLPREIGSADALIADDAGGQPLEQSPVGGWAQIVGEAERGRSGDTEQVISVVLGRGTRAVVIDTSSVASALGSFGTLTITKTDLADPMLDGMARLREGRFPASSDEAAVTAAVARRGAPIGSTITLGTEGPFTVVGVVDRTLQDNQVFVMPSGSASQPAAGRDMRKWLVTTPGGVSWQDVRELNGYGMAVNSRQVVLDPPSADEYPPLPMANAANDDATWGVVIGLLVIMVLLEIALLAGPAFAVGAAKQTRALGLIAAQGGDRSDVRRIMLAQAVIIGASAVLFGAVLGVLLPWLGYPLFDLVSLGQIGQFEVHWSDALLAMLSGLVAAVAAAMLPARAVARMNPVSALAGRRPRTNAHRWPSAVGLVLIAVGGAVALVGSRVDGRTVANISVPAVLVAAGSAVLVAGAVLLAPAAVAMLGRMASSFPTAMRYALRDMGRNQLRTAPAVAAVIAVVAGAMTAGIIAASESARSRAEYYPSGPRGEAVVALGSTDLGTRTVTSQDWQSAQDLVLANVPGGRALAVLAMDPRTGVQADRALVLSDSDLVPPAAFRGGEDGGLNDASWSNDWYNASLLVGRNGVQAVAAALTPQQRTFAEQELAAGRAVRLTSWDGPDRGTMRLDVVSGGSSGEWQTLRTVQVPTVAVRVRGVWAPAVAILPEQVVAESGIEPAISALLISGPRPITVGESLGLQSELNVALAQDQLSAEVIVEPGYSAYLTPGLVVLLAVAFALVLVGSVTASLLSMSDARTDLVTLGEVGAAPGARRRIAATYGAGISLLGALIGTSVGFVPGVSAVWALHLVPPDSLPGTVDYWGNPIPESFLAVPWLLVPALVIAVPLMIGALLYVTTRSRLPRRIRLE